MKFNRLRLVGFKSFVEPTDFMIESGLTGIIGPNGCGKSNLVEALRWVMGENSSKNMRASGMDDVIFSGSGGRPARNMAEVSLVLDNADRTAPAHFNDAESLEITRQIEREEGSTYRINGREVRARDVQLLFADASTGSRSPSMVRQGMIAEIIAAKPQSRRRILEEAAGISGLHSRRAEAELRLKAAEDNLTRLDDVLKQIEAQSDSLKKQAKQAIRYRGLAGDIRKHEALLALIHHTDARNNLAASEHKLEADVREVAERTRLQAEAARLQAIAAHDLPGLREAEATAGGEMQKLVVARETLDGEEKRTKSRIAELERRITQMKGDLARETAAIDDAAQVLARLAAEEIELTSADSSDGDLTYAAEAKAAEAEAALALSEKALAEAQSLYSDVAARRTALEAALRDETQRLERLEADLNKARQELDTLRAELERVDDRPALAAAHEEALEFLQACEAEATDAEAAHVEAREAEARARTPLAEAERKAQKLETEAATLSKLLTAGSGSFWPPVTDEISVEKGYEAALGAALGDDLDASTNGAAPAHWALIAHEDDPALPEGVQALSSLVQAPPALQRRLAQIGVVSRASGPVLRDQLRPGQRLVSKEGDLWRWDGFTQAAEAPTPAARRLVEKNRLGDLKQEAEAARRAAEALKVQEEEAQAHLRGASARDNEARQAFKNATREADSAREKMLAAERRHTEATARISALAESETRLAANCEEAREKRARLDAEQESLVAGAELKAQLDAARAIAAEHRAQVTQARADHQALLREAQARVKRMESIAADRQSWEARRERATGQIAEVDARLAEATEEHLKLIEAPDEYIRVRRVLMNNIAAAEEICRRASDQRAKAETHLNEADKQARAALEAMGTAREDKARSETRLEAARQRLEEILHAIAHDLECQPDDLSALAGVAPGADLPGAEATEKRLETLKHDRERLGAVNLRAEEELNEVDTSKQGLTTEKDDLIEAIRRLRTAIQSLNKEGRERLFAAFDTVNAHFKELFTSLFGGGAAELQLVESDDPLEAGLEILACPPGKKPQVMTLLSGGEQALTAMSLIFAVFLTNPSPICVLDEVDAPLDDANVERFCNLLDEMSKRTETRFVTITHNPITMARMDRLFGVTMAERGVSQLVSVDLAEAERYLEAG
ncbi:chromosome segregation protein SMC [Methyloferula stellata]|uniref:chromosome segregation protein SMC n=1 Tax=Methyloferula stellata TaxID=876270 RepID=UPI000378A288|nr:chromosome segregation protein SMC [Methyloferula stellata]